eukprot:TRINITY_DN6729_c0_g1_i1.p1 TRINITY_DN6729_c0_g1~~TRINITY_DN6729_c0_g1_i1.p1  ORF type:complete len:980 (+),score=171.65 TRINITY_DN6729_c0_g1_i1:417-2942(+)
MIDQTTYGHRKLLQEFGVVPTIGWQIDPFGHSSTQASLLSARVGFDGLFFARIDYQDSAVRNQNKEFEMIWRPSPSLGTLGQVFTGAFERNGYGPPNGFDWDNFGENSEPIQDDPNLEDYNVPSRVEDFVNDVMDQFSANVGSDIMLTLGSDFQYSNAHLIFKNLDKLIDYVNKDGRVNVFYSTPSAYVKAKMSYNTSWAVKTDDFFPYADCPHCYWTGYFTSRPALKRYVRMNASYLNVARQIEALNGQTGQTDALDEALGVAQHHDAVSGTSKQHVAYDYAKRIYKGYDIASKAVNQMISQMTHKNGGNLEVFQQCTMLNESVCASTETNKAFAVVAYNALARTRTETIEVPVSLSSYTVYDSSGAVVASQTVPTFRPLSKHKTAPYTLYFQATSPGVGFNTYFVQPSSGEGFSKPTEVPKNSAPIYIENSVLRVEFSTTTGGISSILNKKTGLSTSISQQFMWYASLAGDGQNSGAYIFRPNSTDAYIAFPGVPQLQLITGKVVNEVRANIGTWLAQTIKLTGENDFLEVEYQVGSIPINDGIGKELITRYSTDLNTNSLYWTDSNGREYQERKRNYRPTWPLQVNEPVSGNYYPVNVGAYIKDATRQFSILNDRSQGGASIQDGQFEIMVHRRTLFDDSRGVGEPLNETDSITPYPNPQRIGTGLHITGTHYLSLDPPNAALSHIRPLQSRVYTPFLLAFSPMAVGVDAVNQWIATHEVTGTALKRELPPNVEMMTLQSTDSGSGLFRLAHQFAVAEDSVLSQPVTVDLAALFSKFQWTNLKETSLTANQNPITKNHQWQVKGENAFSNLDLFDIVPFDGVSVTVNPMDIRTFTFNK